jgi:hypothetical protein
MLPGEVAMNTAQLLIDPSPFQHFIDVSAVQAL